MCSVSISNPEVSSGDTIALTIVSTTATRIVQTSGILTYHMAGERDYTRYLET